MFSKINLGIALGLLCITSNALAQVTWDPTPPPSHVDISGHSGSFSTSVPLRVPSFRGLEPSLSLSYASSSGNGFAGVGWRLAGFGSIERKNEDGGWPRWDGTDTYWLDGRKLVPCGASSSPGCTSGGTHFTENESYARITRDSEDQWTVTDRSGTQTVYLVMGYSATKKFRWGIESRTDTLGNTVDYTWSCATEMDYCYPASITYNGAVITLEREARPDPITSPGPIVLSDRLKTVDVEVSGSRVRVYELVYIESLSTSRSLLSSVQMYGTDAVPDGSGSFVGSFLPATTFTYREDGSYDAFTDGGTWATNACDMSLGTPQQGTGDFNGDGFDDLYCHYGHQNGRDTYVSLNQGDGTFASAALATANWCDPRYATFTTGDFNGDGSTDFVCQKHTYPRDTEVSLANGDGTFATPATWLATNFCELDKPSVRWGTVDANGDGKTDVWCHRGEQWQDAIWVGLSTGSSFEASQWTNWCWTVDAFFTFGPDVNGDGNGDAVCRGASSAFVDVLLSTGTGFYQGTFPSLPYWCQSYSTFGSGDFNGDGKADLWCRQPTDSPDRPKGLYVAISTGEAWTGWTSDTDFTAAAGWCTTHQIGTGDFNGDGRTDFSCHNRTGNAETWVRLSQDRVAGLTAEQLWKSNWCASTEERGGDFNGDGKSDLMCHQGTTTQVALAGSLRGRTDVVETIENGIGGTTSVTYTPSSDWTNTNNPPVRETATSITQSDGRGWSTTTTYTYAGGFIDREKRRDLGFRTGTLTLPKLSYEAAAPYTVTTYAQNLASVGAVESRVSYDGAGNELSKLDNTLVTSGDGENEPYTAKVTKRTRTVYDGSGIPCGSWPCAYAERYVEEYDYDTYGNRAQLRSYGNFDATGDETTSVTEFYPNTSAYIVNKLARSLTYYGIGTSGVKLTESRVHYDGGVTYTLPPAVGLPTNGSVWLDTEDRHILECPYAECLEYDLDGNLTKAIDVKGGETLFTYDVTYNKFPTSVTNALSHVSQTPQWDVLCEAPEQVIDPNGQSTTTSYDTLCRHERTDGPLGSFLENVYVGLGNPTGQHTETRSPSPDGTGYLYSRAYFDGLGRSFVRESKGPAGVNVYSGEVSFNERGLVAASALPRFAGASQYVTTFVYDVQNRLELTSLPDANTVSFDYGLHYTLQTNPEGHSVSSSREANGLTRYDTDYLGGSPIPTTTTTDVDDRTVYTYDVDGNTWATIYDSLGRPITLVDPDSGTEFREFNDAGELVAVVNAMNERTEFTYDLLGRMLTKKTLVGTPQEETTTFVYDEVRGNYFNVGGRTSMFDSAGYRKDDYDALGRPARTERFLDGQSYVFEHTYNTAGLPASTIYPDSQVISWTYDAAGNLETETGTITSSDYDAAGRVTSRSFTNGVISTFSYSPTRGWLENLHTEKNGLVHQDLAYTHYADGMIQTITSAKPMESWSYTYDDLNRLLTAVNVDTPSLTQSFTYNDIGNILTNSQIGTYTYPTPGTARPHAVQTAGGRTYQYDNAGRMTNRNGQVIQWNGDGKPSSIGNIGFTYDGVGERLKKVSGGQTTRYIGGDYEIAGGVVTKYLVGGKQVGNDFFIHHRDHLGSIQAISDATGAEVRRQDHKPFGDQHYAWGSHVESKGWIGEREEETELVYLNARYYDPEIGRFTAPDPIVGVGQALNRYSYSWNNPINLLDPTGLQANPTDDPCDGMTEDECIDSLFNDHQWTLEGCTEVYGSFHCNPWWGVEEIQSMPHGGPPGPSDDCLLLGTGFGCYPFDTEPIGQPNTPTGPPGNEPPVNNTPQDPQQPDKPPRPDDTPETSATDCMTVFGCGSDQKFVQTVNYELQIHTRATAYTAATGVVLGTGLGVAAGAAGGFGALAQSGVGLASRGYHVAARFGAGAYNLGVQFGSGVANGVLIAYRGYPAGRSVTTAELYGEAAGQFGYGVLQGITFRGGSPMPPARTPIVYAGQQTGKAFILLVK